MKALELSEHKGPIEDSAFTHAINALDTMLSNTTQNAPLLSSHPSSNPSGPQDLTIPTVSIACPPRPKKNGRPRKNSLKSWKANSKLEKEYRRGEQPDQLQDVEDNAMVNKTRCISDLLQVT